MKLVVYLRKNITTANILFSYKLNENKRKALSIILVHESRTDPGN